MGYLSLNDYEDVSIEIPYGYLKGKWYGNRKERPILAIHGWLDNLGSFDQLIPLLPDYLGVLCIDLVGHGYSSPLPAGMPYSADDWILIIGRVMKEFKWTKVSLMGHSLGGILSHIHTALAPQTVDMIITLDICQPPYDEPDCIAQRARHMEGLLVEEDRNRWMLTQEPPSYTMTQLREILSMGTFNSVPVEFAQHLLNRSVRKSKLYPDRFYFFRDGRIKYYTLLPFVEELGVELAQNIKDKPYLIIKGSDSPFVDQRSEHVISVLAKNNPHFEMHEVSGLHHVHLTNAKECAKYIVPFLVKHRPPTSKNKVGKGKL